MVIIDHPHCILPKDARALLNKAVIWKPRVIEFTLYTHTRRLRTSCRERVAPISEAHLDSWCYALSARRTKVGGGWGVSWPLDFGLPGFMKE